MDTISIAMYSAAAANAVVAVAWLGRTPQHHDHLRVMMGIDTSRRARLTRFFRRVAGFPRTIAVSLYAIQRLAISLSFAVVMALASLVVASKLVQVAFGGDDIEIAKAVLLDAFDRISRSSFPPLWHSRATLPDAVLATDVLLASFTLLLSGGVLKVAGHWLQSVWLTIVCAIFRHQAEAALGGTSTGLVYRLLGSPTPPRN